MFFELMISGKRTEDMITNKGTRWAYEVNDVYSSYAYPIAILPKLVSLSNRICIFLSYYLLIQSLT